VDELPCPDWSVVDEEPIVPDCPELLPLVLPPLLDCAIAPAENNMDTPRTKRRLILRDFIKFLL
jgi:hypothetical protein